MVSLISELKTPASVTGKHLLVYNYLRVSKCIKFKKICEMNSEQCTDKTALLTKQKL